MPDRSEIEWTDATWNPVTGCTKVSPGCAHCYAETIVLRFKRGPAFLPGLDSVRLHPERLDAPKSWRAARRIFVNSMSDLFHEDVPFDFVDLVFEVMEETSRHTYQILTKRVDRMQAWSEERGADGWPANVWAGTSVENQVWARKRIPQLLEVPAAVRFLSCEPLLKAVDLRGWLHELSENDTTEESEVGIDWVIVGGESGPSARPMRPEWAAALRDQCVEAGVPFFFKQWGGRTPKSGGRELDGRTWDQMPSSR